MSETIIQRNSKDMYIEDMVKYSIIVNRRRAFPEIKDGLKPVQRRALYAMYSLGAIRSTVKSARVTGETIGKYSPHGPTAVYLALIGMLVGWKNKLPLVSGTGNFGTIMGDGPAAERYTEVRISDFCYDAIIGELKEAKYIVDWKDNYDRSTQEPEFLPTKIPILLINGSFGIGVGIQSSIPTFNPTEVIRATRALIKNPNTDIVLIPDHCQPLDIFDTDWKKISETGYGSYKVRGKIKVEEDKNGWIHIHVLSLPDNVTTENVVKKLLELIDSKQLPMIKDVNDASKETVDIVITLKKGSDPNYVIETLYSKCRVQDTVSINFEVVDDIEPKRIGFREYLLNFLDFRATTKFRLYCNKYKDVSTRLHKLDAYIKLIESGEIDNVVNMVKKQKTTDQTELEEYLIKKLHITDLQAAYILATNIKQLSYGYLTKYKEEFKELKKVEPIYKQAITDNGNLIMNEIDQELAELEKKYHIPRICNIVSAAALNNIPTGTFKIIVTESNRIRKLPDTEKINVVKGDQPKFVLRAENTEAILLFDNKGKVFKLPVHKIPITDKQGTGTDVRILSKNLTADIIGLYYEPQLKQIVESKKKHYLVVVSKNNIIKKLDLDDFLNVNLSGLIYSKVRDDDIITGLTICPNNLDVVIYSNQKALRTSLDEIPLLKRNAQGNKAMNTNNPIEGLSVIYPDVSSIIVLTSNGKVNKFPISTFTVHGRGRSGCNVIKLDANDEIHSIYGVRETDKIKVVTTDGIVEIEVANIKSRSGIAAGEKAFSSRSTILHTEVIYQ